MSTLIKTQREKLHFSGMSYMVSSCNYIKTGTKSQRFIDNVIENYISGCCMEIFTKNIMSPDDYLLGIIMPTGTISYTQELKKLIHNARVHNIEIALLYLRKSDGAFHFYAPDISSNTIRLGANISDDLERKGIFSREKVPDGSHLPSLFPEKEKDTATSFEISIDKVKDVINEEDNIVEEILKEEELLLLLNNI